MQSLLEVMDWPWPLKLRGGFQDQGRNKMDLELKFKLEEAMHQLDKESLISAYSLDTKRVTPRRRVVHPHQVCPRLCRTMLPNLVSEIECKKSKSDGLLK